MRKVTVPIDMSSEQKVILGVISMRQFIYLLIGGITLYAYIPIVFNLFSNIAISFIFSVVASIPVVCVVGILGFYKVSKKGLNFDHYLLIKMGYKNQIGVWRKGGR